MRPTPYPSIRTRALPLVASLLAACSSMPDMPKLGLMNEGPPELAVVQIAPTQGNTAAGSARFTQRGSDTLVEVSLKNVPPGIHGFHVHEKGDCSAPDALSAGGHFNPDGMPHGSQETPHHAGDLGNVTAGADGTVSYNFHVKDLALSGDKGIIGRALILHAGQDDMQTQPTGNAGKRLACGVIARTQ